MQGITTGEFAAYYIVWTLVRNMNIVFTPYGWEWRIREGELSAALLRPLHPIHDDIAGFAGWKVGHDHPLAADRGRALDRVRSRRSTSDAARGRRLLRRDLGRLPDPDDVPVVARDGHVLDDARRARSSSSRSRLELLLSGRLVPLPLMPAWAQDVANVLPFQWSFYFPIQTLVGDLSNRELLEGLGIQLLWIVAAHRAVPRRLAVRDQALLGGRELMRIAPPRLALLQGRLAERAPVPGELLHPAAPVGGLGRRRRSSSSRSSTRTRPS